MRQFLANSLFEIAVRARKSPWIETNKFKPKEGWVLSGLVRARGLKHSLWRKNQNKIVRARKSPWIETLKHTALSVHSLSGLVRARGLKPRIAEKAL